MSVVGSDNNYFTIMVKVANLLVLKHGSDMIDSKPGQGYLATSRALDLLRELGAEQFEAVSDAIRLRCHNPQEVDFRYYTVEDSGDEGPRLPRLQVIPEIKIELLEFVAAVWQALLDIEKAHISQRVLAVA